MTNHIDSIILLLLGALTTAFFTLIWKRLDSIDKRLDRIEIRLQQLGDDLHVVVGRLDEISKHV